MSPLPLTSLSGQYNGTAWPSAQSLDLGNKEIGWQALGPTIACTILSTTVVALRWYARGRIARCIGPDDHIILCSLVLAWVICIILGLEFNEGLGVYHGRHVDPQHLAKLVIANNNVWALTVNITKASILLQYLRICINPFARKLCYVLLTMLVPAVCWTIFAGTFLCRPVAKLWDPQLPGHCMNAETYWLSAAGINIALDFLVLIVPLPLLAVLRLPRRQKQCLVTLFLLGFFVCIVSVVRLITVDVTADAENYIQSGIFAILWSAVEANTGIICASLFALKPLIGAWCPRLLDEKIDPWLSICLPTTKTDMWRPRDSDATLVATSPTPPQSPKGRVCKERPGAVGRSDPPSAATSPPRTDEVMGFVDMLAEDRRRGSLLTEPSRGNSQPRA